MPPLTERSRALRAARVGASEVPAILGIDPYRGPMTVWERLTSGKEIEQTPRMRIGTALEEPIARLWAELTGNRIRLNDRTRVRGNLAATADGFALDRGGLLEIKWSTGAGIWVGDAVPESVYWQAVAQSAVYGRTGRNVTVVALVAADLREWVVTPTRGERTHVRRAVDEFLTTYVEPGEIPVPRYPAELDAYLRLVQGTDPDARRPATDAEQTAADAYLTLRAEMGLTRHLADKARAELLHLIAADPKPRIVGDGWHYANTGERVTITDNATRKETADAE